MRAPGLSPSKEDGLSELSGHHPASFKATSCLAWILIGQSLTLACDETTKSKCAAWKAFPRREVWPGSRRHSMDASILVLYILPDTLILTANIKTKYHYGSFKYERAAAGYQVSCGVSGIGTRLGFPQSRAPGDSSAGWPVESLLFTHK